MSVSKSDEKLLISASLISPGKIILFDQAFDTVRGTKRQFSENICWEDDLRSRILGAFKISYLPASPRNFERLKNGIIAPF